MQLINSVILSFKREVREVIKNRLYLAMLVILPIIALAFYTLIFLDGNIKNLPIAIVNEDGSESSYRLISMLNATRDVEVVSSIQSSKDAERMLRSGDIYGFIVIPKGLGVDIYSGTTATIELFLSGANLSASGIIERATQQVILTMAAGISLNRLLASGIEYHQAMIEISPINVQSHIISNPYLNYGYYLAPVFMFMAIVIFTVLSTIYAFGRELRYATAKEWLSAANGSMWGAIIGKALPITIVMTIFTQVIFAILFVFMGMECTGSYLIITLGSILFIIAYQSIAILIITLTANQRLALSLGGGYAVMAFTFSGITFPTTAMFGVAKVISTIFPLGYFVQIFINEAMRGAPTEYSIKYLIAISLFILPIFIVKRRLKRISLDDRYWSRD